MGPCVANGPSITVYPVGSSGDVSPRARFANVAAGGIAFDAKSNIYVTTESGIQEYAASKGSAGPLTIIAVPGIGATGPIAVDAAGNIAVASAVASEDSILFYPAGSKGTVAPSAILSGENTGLARLADLAFDRSGNLYAANRLGGPGLSGSVTVYAPGSAGDASPTLTITTADTGIFQPVGVASKRQGNIYVASAASVSDSAGDQGPGAVSVFPPGSNGAISSSARIFGPSTKLNQVQGVTVDAAGKIYVLNYVPGQGYSVVTFAAGSSGDVAPLSSLEVGGFVGGFAVDAAGDIYVNLVASGTRYVSLFMYPAGSSGAASPAMVIVGSETGLFTSHSPSIMAIDADLNVYAYSVPLQGLPGLLVFAPGSSGNVAPAHDISGTKTRLGYLPVGLAVDASGNTYVLSTKGHPDWSLNVYAAESTGNVAPKLSITGSTIQAATESGRGFLTVVPAATP